MDGVFSFSAAIHSWGNLHFIPYWLFHPLKRTEQNRREMRDSTGNRAAIPYLPFTSTTSSYQSLRVLEQNKLIEPIWHDLKTWQIVLFKSLILSHYISAKSTLTDLCNRRTSKTYKFDHHQRVCQSTGGSTVYN